MSNEINSQLEVQKDNEVVQDTNKPSNMSTDKPVDKPIVNPTDHYGGGASYSTALPPDEPAEYYYPSQEKERDRSQKDSDNDSDDNQSPNDYQNDQTEERKNKGGSYNDSKNQIMGGSKNLLEFEEKLDGLDDGYNAGEAGENAAKRPKPIKGIKATNQSDKSSENEESKDVSPFNRQETKIYSCPGYKMHDTQITDTKSLSVKVMDSEVVDEGFFSAKYLSFKLKVLPWDTEIDRRDKDFNGLRDFLVKTFPHILIPPLSESKTIMKNDQWYLHKRKFIIENFLNKCLSIPVLRS